MAKNILQDIVPPEKRSIRNIPLPSRRNPASAPQQSPASIPQSEPRIERRVEDVHVPESYSYDEEPPRSRRYSKKAIWLASAGAIVIVLFAFSSLFSGATVRVQPKETSVSAAGVVFEAQRGVGVGIPYEIVTISQEEGVSVPAEGEEEVEEKASGRIVIYNAFDSSEQRLIKNTRFETEEGLIYRINESVVVPGSVTSNGSTLPGSIEVTVYADEAGEEYNVGLKDFTIPGFKSDSARYATIYARSKTDMTGGFVGTRKKVAEEDLEAARTALAESLRSKLQEELQGQVPENFVAYEDGLFFSFEPLPQSGGSGSSVVINERGTLGAVIFNKTVLASRLAEELAPDFEGSSATLKSDEIPFAVQNRETFDLNDPSSLTFTIDGNVSLVSQFDKDTLAADLVGKSRKDIPTILVNYPSIAKMDAMIRPFWKKSFPSDPADINIETIFEE
jgi:hypothetical protein